MQGPGDIARSTAEWLAMGVTTLVRWPLLARYVHKHWEEPGEEATVPVLLKLITSARWHSISKWKIDFMSRWHTKLVHKSIGSHGWAHLNRAHFRPRWCIYISYRSASEDHQASVVMFGGYERVNVDKIVFFLATVACDKFMWIHQNGPLSNLCIVMHGAKKVYAVPKSAITMTNTDHVLTHGAWACALSRSQWCNVPAFRAYTINLWMINRYIHTYCRLRNFRR